MLTRRIRLAPASAQLLDAHPCFSAQRKFDADDAYGPQLPDRGRLQSARTRPSTTHFYNLIDGVKWDLTVGQFPEPTPYDDTLASREQALADMKQARHSHD
jgi:hypothetical protein